MKIHILNESKQSIGGGWSFIANFKKGLIVTNFRSPLVDDWRESDIVFIPSASMVSRDTVNIARMAGKKIVLRVDNIPRNSRNRGAGTGRLHDIAQVADQIIFQSEWARDYISPFIKKTGKIIYNGIDTEIFKPEGDKVNFGKHDSVYLYSRFNRDETKGWERAWYEFLIESRKNKNIKLVIVGQFSDELICYNFDFFCGEKVEYLGIVENPIRMANIMRGCNILLAPYFNDAYSNTIQEALGCGLEVRADNSGGTPELLKNGVINCSEMVTNYLASFNELLS